MDKKTLDGLSLGIQFILIVTLFTLGGYYLDGLHSYRFPIFLLIMLVIGFFIGLYILLKESKRFARRQKKRGGGGGKRDGEGME